MSIVSTRVNELPMAQDPAQFEIPGFDITTNAGAKALMSTLKGDKGDPPTISISAHSIPNGSTPTVTQGGTITNPTYDFGIPMAADGQTPQFQVANDYIQYRYGTGAWNNLVSLDTLRLHYADLTDAQKQELMQPALTAADTANDAAMSANEAAQNANTAAANVKDGKTPQFQAGAATGLPEGAAPTVTVTQTGTDASGNPIYSISMGIPKGNKGDLGDLAVHTDIKSLDTPTFTILDPNDPNSTITKTFASLDDLPLQPHRTVYDVTNFFTTNVPVDKFLAEMIDYQSGEKIIQLYAEDRSETSNELIITASQGYGSSFDDTGNNAKLALGIDSNGSTGIYPINITQETTVAQTTITVPPQVKDLDIRYWLGSVEYQGSYWVDSNGIYHLFESNNTPISGLCSAINQGVVTINGVSLPSAQIKEIRFGSSYNSVVNIPNNFIRGWVNLTKLDLSGLINVETFSNIAMSNLNSLYSLDISMMTKLSRFGTAFCTQTQNSTIKEFIIGTLDFSQIQKGDNAYFAVPAANNNGTIYSYSQELVDIFKAGIGAQYGTRQWSFGQIV